MTSEVTDHKNARAGEISRVEAESAVAAGSRHAFDAEIDGARKHPAAVVIGMFAYQIDPAGSKAMHRRPMPKNRKKIAV